MLFCYSFQSATVDHFLIKDNCHLKESGLRQFHPTDHCIPIFTQPYTSIFLQRRWELGYSFLAMSVEEIMQRMDEQLSGSQFPPMTRNALLVLVQKMWRSEAIEIVHDTSSGRQAVNACYIHRILQHILGDSSFENLETSISETQSKFSRFPT